MFCVYVLICFKCLCHILCCVRLPHYNKVYLLTYLLTYLLIFAGDVVNKCRHVFLANLPTTLRLMHNCFRLALRINTISFIWF